MGRINKKKLAEYAEAAENEELNKSDDVVSEKKADTDVEDEEVLDNNEAAQDMQNDTASDDAANDDEDDDFKSLQGENEENEEKSEGTKKTKRRAAEKNAKKISSSATGDDLSGGAEDSDDEPLNGSSSGGSPAKKAKKSAPVKAKAKTGLKKGGKRGKAKKEVDEDALEEEYEVKDVVDHKVERGVSYFLIRWKGYTKADDTWEAEDTLSCPEIIEKFKKKQDAEGEKPKKAAAGAKRGRKSNAKDDPDKEWEVDKIIDYAVEKDGRVFRIRWKGFSAKYDTWEPEENLCCDDIIDKFMKRMKQQENISFKELREEPKKTKRLVNETPRISLKNEAGRKSKRSVNKKRIYYGDSDE